MAVICPASAAHAATIYVDASATGANNGTSWTNAYTSLQTGLADAGSGDEIWVAAGVYKPAPPGGNRAISFQLANGVGLYGGFPVGGGTFEQRDPDVHVTTLSGDLNGNDGPNFANNGENTYHVVKSQNLTAATVMDGFLVTAGNASGPLLADKRGGGGHFADNNGAGSLSILHCRFDGNACLLGGGGLFLDRGDVQVTDCLFMGNASSDAGGGAYTLGETPLVENCVFEGNVATEHGGGLAISSALTPTTIRDCTFDENIAGFGGGGLFYGFPSAAGQPLNLFACELSGNQSLPNGVNYGGGGLYVQDAQINLIGCSIIDNAASRDGGGAYLDPQASNGTSARLINSRFIGNTTTDQAGGGVFLVTGQSTDIINCVFAWNAAAGFGGGLASPTGGGGPGRSVVNSTFAHNSAGAPGGGVLLADNDDEVANCVAWANSDSTGTGENAQILTSGGVNSVNYSIIQNWTGALGGVGNSAADPQFVDADGADNVSGTQDDDYRLAPGSPGVDSGNNGAVLADTIDVDGDANTSEPVPLDVAGNDRFLDDPDTVDNGSGLPPIVDIGAHEFGEPSIVAQFVGSPGSSWFIASNWSTGSVPDATTDVDIEAEVVIDQAGASADSVHVLSGGEISIGSGSLTAISLTLDPGATLSLASADALLDVGSMNVMASAIVDWTAGIIQVTGGNWNHPAGISIGCSGDAQLVLNSAQVFAQGVSICAAGTLAGTGTINTDVSNSGTLDPGGSTGQIVITGAYSQSSSGALVIELDGYAPGITFDRVLVTGNATLAGSVDVVPLEDFDHVIGGTQTFLTAQFINGDFASPDLPSLPDGAQFFYEASNTSRALFTMITSTGPRLYVNVNGAAGGNAQSWDTSVQSLQSALDIAAEFPGAIDEIWVAQGVYVPSRLLIPNFLRSATFSLVPSVALLGGFDGTESSALERNPDKHETVLSGDVIGDDEPDFLNRGDNVYTVVQAIGNPFTPDTVIDGFTIRSGNADGVDFFDKVGGGMIAAVGAPTIRHCRFVGNSSFSDGGGLYITGSPTVNMCDFLGNRSFNYGGAMRVESSGTVTVRGCNFEDNLTFGSDSGDGGALYGGAGSFFVIDCSFINNIAEGGSGGGAATAGFVSNCRFIGNSARVSGGGLYSITAPSSVVANSIFVGNSAGVGFPFSNGQHGGGLSLNNPEGCAVVNCAFVGNVAAHLGGGLQSIGAADLVSITNCIATGNTDSQGSNESAQVGGAGALSINYCNIQGWTGSLGGVGNFDADPAFVDADGPDDIIGTEDDDLRLGAGSLCIDAGDVDALPADEGDIDGDGLTLEPLPRDLDLHLRRFDDPGSANGGNGSPPIVDLGPYEFGAPAGEPGEYIGRPGGSWFDPSNWAGGSVPTSTTTVLIHDHVIVSGSAAIAADVVIVAGGILQVDSSLAATLISVSSGGSLVLTSQASLIQVQSLLLADGAALEWIGGTIEVIGGAMTSAAGISIGCIQPATLVLTAGAVVTAPDVSVCEAGELRGNGTLVSALTNAGSIRPGASPGLLLIDGDLTLESTSQINIEVQGSEPITSHDVIQVTGAATLDGTITVVVAQKLTLSLTELGVILAGKVSGAIDEYLIDPLPGGFELVPLQTASQVALVVIPPGPRLYVDLDAPSDGDGTSWASAASNLADAMRAARLSGGEITEIWTAEGSYLPNEPIDVHERFATFSLVNGLAVYGGFAGGETDLSQRDVINNVTILTGDLDGDDGPNFTNNDDNAYHVVTADGVDGSAVLDGFTITAGATDSQFRGGGLLCSVASPVIRLCTFDRNQASAGGGAAAVDGSNLLLESCTFVGNAAPADTSSGKKAGGLTIEDESHATLANCLFAENSSGTVGGLFIGAYSSAELTSCTLDGNDASGVVCEDGAITMIDCQVINSAGRGAEIISTNSPDEPFPDTSTLVTNCQILNNLGGGLALQGFFLDNDHIADCEFTGNSGAQRGGGLYIEKNSGAKAGFLQSPTVTGCTFTGNSATLEGGAVWVGQITAAHLNAVFSGCNFTGNSAPDGGALFSVIGPTTATVGPTMTDCEFQDNVATDEGGAIRNAGSSLTLLGCTFESNSAVTESAVYNIFDGTLRGDSIACLADDEIASTDPIRPGELSPEDPIGLITIDGALRLIDRGPPNYDDDPSLYVDLAGTSPGTQFDHVDATDGEVELTGGLFVDFIDGFTPGLNDSFRIIESPPIANGFGAAFFDALPDGLIMTVEYDSAGALLTVSQLENIIGFADPNSTGLSGVPSGATTADLDNDGDLDVALVIPGATPQDAGQLVVLLNQGINGNGEWLGFAAGTPLGIAASPTDVAAGNFNGDALPDIAICHASSNAVIAYLNAGGASFNFLQLITVGSAPAALTTGALNSDGLDDIVAANAGSGNVTLLFNIGGTQFLGAPLATSPGPVDVAFADLDNDLDQDILTLNQGVGGSQPFLSVNRRLPSGSYEAAVLYATGALPASLVACDLNGDGFVDVATANQTSATVSIFINHADQTASLANGVQIPIGDAPSSLTALDLENDGDLDLALVAENLKGNPVVRVARNDLDGGSTVIFSNFNDLQNDGVPVIVLSGDLNDDGISDIIAVNESQGGIAGVGGNVAALLNTLSPPPVCPADLVPAVGGDGVVGAGDLGELLANWGSCPGCEADLFPVGAPDGIVGAGDLAVLLASWGNCP
jgi:hypothetical protein